MIKHIPEKNRASSEGLFSSVSLVSPLDDDDDLCNCRSQFLRRFKRELLFTYLFNFPLKLHCTAQPQFREVLVYLLTFVKQKSKKKNHSSVEFTLLLTGLLVPALREIFHPKCFSLPLRCERPTFERYFALAARICDWLIYGRANGR